MTQENFGSVFICEKIVETINVFTETQFKAITSTSSGGLPAVNLKWLSPKLEGGPEAITNCIGTYRISPLDVLARHSTCLTNFLTSGDFMSKFDTHSRLILTFFNFDKFMQLLRSRFNAFRSMTKIYAASNIFQFAEMRVGRETNTYACNRRISNS